MTYQLAYKVNKGSDNLLSVFLKKIFPNSTKEQLSKTISRHIALQTYHIKHFAIGNRDSTN